MVGVHKWFVYQTLFSDFDTYYPLLKILKSKNYINDDLDIGRMLA